TRVFAPVFNGLCARLGRIAASLYVPPSFETLCCAQLLRMRAAVFDWCASEKRQRPDLDAFARARVGRRGRILERRMRGNPYQRWAGSFVQCNATARACTMSQALRLPITGAPIGTVESSY